MLTSKHLKMLQHISIFTQIIFRELISSLSKSLNLKFKNVKSQILYYNLIIYIPAGV